MTNQQAIINALTKLRTDLINSLQAKGKIASGRTVEQITITTQANRSQLNLPGYLIELERGRGPTGKNAAAGNPPMISRIQQWCSARGIPAKAAWAIKKKIDKLGYRGKPGVLTEPLSDANINLKLNEAGEQIAAHATKQIIDSLNI